MTKRVYTYEECESAAAYWLYLGNRAAERGEDEKAERHYEKSQTWHDRMNETLGNGEGRANSDLIKGMTVRIHGRKTVLIARLLSIRGGWVIEPPVMGLRMWNEDEMRPLTQSAAKV